MNCIQCGKHTNNGSGGAMSDAFANLSFGVIIGNREHRSVLSYLNGTAGFSVPWIDLDEWWEDTHGDEEAPFELLDAVDEDGYAVLLAMNRVGTYTRCGKPPRAIEEYLTIDPGKRREFVEFLLEIGITQRPRWYMSVDFG